MSASVIRNHSVMVFQNGEEYCMESKLLCSHLSLPSEIPSQCGNQAKPEKRHKPEDLRRSV
jgi:hypothetical protein